MSRKRIHLLLCASVCAGACGRLGFDASALDDNADDGGGVNGRDALPTGDAGAINPGDWSGAMQVQVDNPGPVAVGAVVFVELDTSTLIAAGDMEPDCADFRFSLNGDAIPYWIESGCDTTSTLVWVRIATLRAGTTTLDLYFGNSAAVDASDGVATFDAFVGFDGGSLDDGWRSWSPDAWGTLTVEGGVLRIDGEGNDGSRLFATGVVADAPFAFENHTLEVRSRWSMSAMVANGHNAQWEVQLSEEAAPSGAETGDNYEWDFQWYRGIAGIHTGSYRFVRFDEGEWTEVDKSIVNNPTPEQFEIWQVDWTTDSTQVAQRSGDDGATWSALWSGADDKWSLPVSLFPALVLETQSTTSHSVEVDWLRVRRKIDPVPTATVLLP